MLLLLVPTLFYPIGPDQGMFLLGGEKILRGAIHYRDIVDVKPPLIYYVYAAVAATLGTSEVSIRIFDLLLQIATVALLVTMVRRATGDDRWSVAAGIGYTLLYLLQEYQSTAQVESFVGLLGLGIIHLRLRSGSRWSLLAIGVLAGLLFLLKFTLGVMLAAAMLAELLIFGERGWRALGAMLLMALGFLLTLGGFVLYLTMNDAAHGFLLMQQFTRGYVRTMIPSLGVWLKSLFEVLPEHTSEFYSLFLFALTVVGMARTVPIRDAEEMPLDRGDARRMARFCAFAFLLMLATLPIEGKYYSYHFIRLYPFGAVLMPLGLFSLLRAIRGRRHAPGFGRVVGSGLLAMALIFGPLPRAAWHALPMALRLTGGEDALDRYYDTSDGQSRVELKQVATAVRENLPRGGTMFAAAATGSLVYYFSGQVPAFKIFHSAFIVAPFAPEEWRDSTRAWVLRARPDVIVLQDHDNRSDQNGVMTSSRDAFLAIPDMARLLHRDYHLVYRTDSYEVMRRTGD